MNLEKSIKDIQKSSFVKLDIAASCQAAAGQSIRGGRHTAGANTFIPWLLVTFQDSCHLSNIGLEFRFTSSYSNALIIWSNNLFRCEEMWVTELHIAWKIQEKPLEYFIQKFPRGTGTHGTKHRGSFPNRSVSHHPKHFCTIQK